MPKKEETLYNYNVDDYGTLYVYKGRTNILLFTIEDCQNMTDKQLTELIDDELERIK